jgi:hypothetical protein
MATCVGWRMLHLDPALLAREVEEEIDGQVEIVRPIARDPLFATHFAQLFRCLTTPRSDRLASDENLLRSLAARDGPPCVQWPVALRRKGDHAPGPCSRHISFPG